MSPPSRDAPRDRAEARRAEAAAIRVFVTGGTFDKEYDEIRGEFYFYAGGAVPCH